MNFDETVVILLILCMTSLMLGIVLAAFEIFRESIVFLVIGGFGGLFVIIFSNVYQIWLYEHNKEIKE